MCCGTRRLKMFGNFAWLNRTIRSAIALFFLTNKPPYRPMKIFRYPSDLIRWQKGFVCSSFFHIFSVTTGENRDIPGRRYVWFMTYLQILIGYCVFFSESLWLSLFDLKWHMGRYRQRRTTKENKYLDCSPHSLGLHCVYHMEIVLLSAGDWSKEFVICDKK